LRGEVKTQKRLKTNISVKIKKSKAINGRKKREKKRKGRHEKRGKNEGHWGSHLLGILGTCEKKRGGRGKEAEKGHGMRTASNLLRNKAEKKASEGRERKSEKWKKNLSKKKTVGRSKNYAQRRPGTLGKKKKHKKSLRKLQSGRRGKQIRVVGMKGDGGSAISRVFTGEKTEINWEGRSK